MVCSDRGANSYGKGLCDRCDLRSGIRSMIGCWRNMEISGYVWVCVNWLLFPVITVGPQGQPAQCTLHAHWRPLCHACIGLHVV